MPTLTDDTLILAKTKELCASILEDAEFKSSLAKVDTFAGDSESRTLFIQLSQRGEELHQKQHSGSQPSAEEIREFQELQSSAMENNTIKDFIEAQNELQELHSTIAGYVAKTLELGRVPDAADFEEEEHGCGDHDCGCSH